MNDQECYEILCTGLGIWKLCKYGPWVPLPPSVTTENHRSTNKDFAIVIGGSTLSWPLVPYGSCSSSNAPEAIWRWQLKNPGERFTRFTLISRDDEHALTFFQKALICGIHESLTFLDIMKRMLPFRSDIQKNNNLVRILAQFRISSINVLFVTVDIAKIRYWNYLLSHILNTCSDESMDVIKITTDD